ncbi:MAG: glycosyltransferase [Paludibacteraceae bacterium]
MKKKPLISIVIPNYNSEKYINECIDSIIGQSFHDFEIIITDDGSIDKSIEIISSYADQRIVLIKNNHNFINSRKISF